MEMNGEIIIAQLLTENDSKCAKFKNGGRNYRAKNSFQTGTIFIRKTGLENE